MAPSLSIEKHITLDYDEEEDVLYFALGEPQPALGWEVRPDVVLRYVPPSIEIVGITIVHFLRHFPQPIGRPFFYHVLEVLVGILRDHPKIPI